MQSRGYCVDLFHHTASILIILEYPTEAMIKAQSPLEGSVGEELVRLLTEANIPITSCSFIFAFSDRPAGNKLKYYFSNKESFTHPGEYARAGQERITRIITKTCPSLIITMGEGAFWALRNSTGTHAFRGSQLSHTAGTHTCKFLPCYNPASVLKQLQMRFILLHDLKRAARWLRESPGPAVELPEKTYIIEPSIYDVRETLEEFLTTADRGPLVLSGDIETRNQNIACFGIAPTKDYGICIPFMAKSSNQTPNYWILKHEFEVVSLIKKLFTHPNITWVFQNGLYDLQYFAREWGMVPRMEMDTMLTHHVIWGVLPKSLDFQSSLYCEFYRFWKKDGRDYNPDVHDESRHWKYNLDDCFYMHENYETLRELVKKQNLEGPNNFQLRQFSAVLKIMLRGVRTSATERERLDIELTQTMEKINDSINYILDQKFNPGSSHQVQRLFYKELGEKPVRNRATGRPSADEKSLLTLRSRNPIYRPIMDRILAYRRLATCRNTFIRMPPDFDGRMRCSYNIAGTETFRYSSSKNAFGSGGNLQTLPEEKDTPLPGMAAPNVKKLFLPDPDYWIFEADLDRADAFIVAAEAQDKHLLKKLRSGDVHILNAREIFNRPDIIDDDGEGGRLRKKAKAGVHATNYLTTPRTLAKSMGITTKEAEHFIETWFSLHPAIREWHKAIQLEVSTTRSLTNILGFRRMFFDRISSCLPEAVAWKPQSTVALVIDTGLVNIEENLPRVQTLLQVHDSLVFQIHKDHVRTELPKVRDAMSISLPYETPLTIPVSVEGSPTSLGDKVKLNWNGEPL